MDLESIKGKEHKISKTRNNISPAYNDYKEFEGRKYTGMRVGGLRRSSWDRVSLVYSCSSECQKTRCKYLHNINGWTQIQTSS